MPLPIMGTEYALPKEVAEWDPANGPLHITGAEYALWNDNEVKSFNAWLEGKRANPAYLVDRKADMFKIEGLALTTIFQGTPDARLAAKDMATATGPFRRRYRPLNEDEVSHHDLIKDVATELWNLIEGIPGVRDAHLDDVDTQNAVRRDMALARTALEDTVMRAVRALTA